MSPSNQERQKKGRLGEILQERNTLSLCGPILFFFIFYLNPSLERCFDTLLFCCLLRYLLTLFLFFL
ncbi:hypothetical protein BKA57DRAFT_456816 [Linnemannia elongata]|nr:hypothetical protein BKA57DRAFT_456816 [Linnemannia elongata]